jgi:hypothetical protein
MAMTIFMRSVSLFCIAPAARAGGRDSGTAEPAERCHSSRFKTRAKPREKEQATERYGVFSQDARIAAMQRPYLA